MRVEERQRLFTSATNLRHRVLRMTTYAAGLRVGEVVRLPLTDIASDRLLLRVNQGKGRKDRSTLLSARLLTARRAYWQRCRPAPRLFTGQDRPQPMPIAIAQKISSHTKRVAGITHGKGIETLPGTAISHVSPLCSRYGCLSQEALQPWMQALCLLHLA
jgi:integrase/recombinase XerD